uniref:Replication protein A 70 kDa DNA-binding subunit B/D first OB fold domain-containing protein n=1 Tax=Brassica oleracea var. oleracea TaxID=109376 RepID=A0A0D3BTW6_BRAOL
MLTYACLTALVPGKKQPAIRVQIVRTWMSPFGLIRPNTCMVFGDEKGSMIEATLPWGVVLPYEINLDEGDWFEILDFKLIHASGLIRTTRSKYHINLTHDSVVTKIQPITECNFLFCASYKTILRGLYHPKFCIGLCGALVEVGDIQDFPEAQANQFNHGNQPSIRFTQVKCVAYGSLAEKLYEYWSSTTANVVVCVLKLWRIEWGNGRFRCLTNIEGCSDILFDPEIPEIHYFKSICDQHVRLADGLFLEVSSHLQGRLMHSSHGGEGGDTRMLILLVRED